MKLKIISYAGAIVGCVPAVVLLGYMIEPTRTGAIKATFISMSFMALGMVGGYWIGKEEERERST